jgi:hypothetical protein
MNKGKLYLLLIFTSILLMACSNDSSKANENQSIEDTISNSLNKTSTEDTSKEDISKEDTSEEEPSIGTDTTTGSISDNTDISQKVKDYILNGQGDKPEADKIKWSEAFLDQLNIEDLYQDYLTNDGNEDDIHEFALYLTSNAPMPDNWKDLVAADLRKNYDVEISRIELLEGDLYQIYVEIDGKEVPYVVANARTGYYHG